MFVTPWASLLLWNQVQLLLLFTGLARFVLLWFGCGPSESPTIVCARSFSICLVVPRQEVQGNYALEARALERINAVLPGPR